MSTEAQTYYQVAPGLEVIWLAEHKVLLSGHACRLVLEGEATHPLVDRVLPLLDGSLSLRDVVHRIPELEGTDVDQHLQRLAEEGILVPLDLRISEQQSKLLNPLSSLIPFSAHAADKAQAILASTRIAIFGLEGPGASLALMLAQHGIGTLVLADPYPCEGGNLALMPMMNTASVGVPRDEIVRLHLLSASSRTVVKRLGSERLTAADVDSAAEECDFLVGCFDRGFGSINHWINRASLRRNKSAIFAELNAHSATIGPLVITGATSCYMCYRMRALACADDFETAQACERHFNGQERPRMHARSVLPSISHLAAASLCAEIVKHLLGLSDLTIAGKIMTISALDNHTEVDTVLQHPRCPECQEKDSVKRAPVGLIDLLNDAGKRGNILSSAKHLVSERVGIVSDCGALQKDQREPRSPYVFFAKLSNNLQARKSGPEAIPSGKGATYESARASAIGEAIETYTATSWDVSDIVYARRSELDGPAIDPRELVVYRDEQYDELPFARYSETTRLGWIRARSLVSDRVIHVPAIAVLLDYPAAPEERLFPSSSTGLAAGGTLLDAVLRGALEVIERDAFLIAWANRLTGMKVEPLAHPDAAVRTHCRAARRRDLDISLIRLPTDAPVHVFLATAIQSTGDGPAAAIGLGADFEPAAAARSAIWEAHQVRTILRMQLRDPSVREHLAHLAADPSSVSAPDDHALLFCSRDLTPALSFLLDQPTQEFLWPTSPATTCQQRLTLLVDHFAAEHRDFLYVDLTSRDLAQVELSVARTIIPGYQPIHFGAKACRLGGDRLFDLPVRLGLRSAASAPAALNPYPHPLG